MLIDHAVGQNLKPTWGLSGLRVTIHAKHAVAVKLMLCDRLLPTAWPARCSSREDCQPTARVRRCAMLEIFGQQDMADSGSHHNRSDSYFAKHATTLCHVPYGWIVSRPKAPVRACRATTLAPPTSPHAAPPERDMADEKIWLELRKHMQHSQLHGTLYLNAHRHSPSADHA